MTWLIRHVMCAFYPRTDELPGILDTDVDAFLRRYRRESPMIMWVGMIAGAVLFAVSPLLTVYVPLPSFLLPKGLLDRHAFRITYSKIYLLRQAVFLPKMAAGFCWAEHPTVRAKMSLAPYPAGESRWREGDA